MSLVTAERFRCPFVVLKDAPEDPDSLNRLFKWCAEYTKTNPWTFVLLQDVEVTKLQLENIDRCDLCKLGIRF